MCRAGCSDTPGADFFAQNCVLRFLCVISVLSIAENDGFTVMFFPFGYFMNTKYTASTRNITAARWFH